MNFSDPMIMGAVIIGIVIAVVIVQAFAYHCPKCKKAIDKTATICPYCKSNLVGVR